MNSLQSSQSNHASVHRLPAVTAHDFLPPLSRWTSVGGLVLIGLMAAAIALTSVMKYKVTVKTQASIRPAGELRVVQAATAGAITSIAVAENETVRVGDIIATIDDSQLQTRKSQLQSSLQQMDLQIVQVNGQIQSLNHQMIAESDRIAQSITAASAELRQRQREHLDKQTVTVADVEEAEANLKAVQASFAAAQSKQNRYQTIANEGALSFDQLEEAQLIAQQQEQSVAAAEARLNRLQAVLNPDPAEVAIATQRIAQEKATGTAALSALNKERQALLQQRVELQKQRERDSRELRQIELSLKQTIVTATADGTISRLNLRNSGQTVNPGEEIAQIVPDDMPLQIKAYVTPDHRNKLSVGQVAQMRVSACPYPDYGTLRGTVQQISKDTLKPQATGAIELNSTPSNPRNAIPVYEVTIAPEQIALTQGNRKCAIKFGMEGTVDIISREETVLQFFLRKARLIADF